MVLRVIASHRDYMQSLVRQAAKEGRTGARLLIVTGQPDERLAVRIGSSPSIARASRLRRCAASVVDPVRSLCRRG
jgi:hypothetical protein